jgi:hypothetical protein
MEDLSSENSIIFSSLGFLLSKFSCRYYNEMNIKKKYMQYHGFITKNSRLLNAKEGINIFFIFIYRKMVII